MNERLTPETDSQCYDCEYQGHMGSVFTAEAGKSHPYGDHVSADFARKLERERNEARSLLDLHCRDWADDDSRVKQMALKHGINVDAAADGHFRGVVDVVEKMSLKLDSMREAIKEAHAALEACMEDSGELLAEHDWWKDEPRCGYQERYEENKQRIENAKTTLAKLQPFLA